MDPCIYHLITLPGITLPKPALIALTGAGGKTSVLFWLAQQFKNRGLRVFCTTTTRMYRPTPSQCDTLLLDDNPTVRLDALKKHAQASKIIYCASVFKPSPHKVAGLSTQEVDAIKASGLFDVCLVEADGARGLAIKSPASHEPVIPASTDAVIALTSAEVLLRPAEPDTIHRWALFANITQCHQDTLIDANILRSLIIHPEGLFKNTPQSARHIWAINKLDLAQSVLALTELAQTVLASTPLLDTVWLTTMQTNPSLSALARQ